MYRKVFLLILVSLLTFYSCGEKDMPGEETQKPARVANAVEESALSTVTLSPKAEERLGIEISLVEYKKLPGSLELGGEIIPVPGNDARVSAPVSGIVLHTIAGKIPPAGKFVKKGEVV